MSGTNKEPRDPEEGYPEQADSRHREKQEGRHTRRDIRWIVLGGNDPPSVEPAIYHQGKPQEAEDDAQDIKHEPFHQPS